MINTNYIVKIVNGKPVIFGAAGSERDGTAPAYIFETKEAFDSALEAGMIPIGALIIKTYDAIEMAGGPFDAELGDSENAPQNKAVYNAITVLKDRINENGKFLWSGNSEFITTVVGQTYYVCGLELPAGRWFLIGQTLAIGNQWINGADWALISRNAITTAEHTNISFGIANGEREVSIAVQAEYQSSVIHDNDSYVNLTAIKIG